MRHNVRRRLAAAALISLATGTSAWADFTMEQTSQITGGALVGMMKTMGAFSKASRQVLDPQQISTSISGNRMVTVHPHSTTIIDLDKETVTTIYTDNQTYSVTTFVEMARAMEKALARADKKSGANGEMNVKVDLKDTGNTKQINGMKASETIMTIAMEGRDAKSGQTGGMGVTADMWTTPVVKGYEEYREFGRKMAAKMASYPQPGLGAMGMMRPELMKGMAELAKESSKLNGMPVLTITRVGVTADGKPLAAPTSTDAPMPVESPSAKSTAGSAAGDAATSAGIGAALGRTGKVGGMIGGLGGFGRKKKTEEQAQSTPPASGGGSTQAAAQDGALMEMRTEVTSFSSAPVPTAKFEVPTGFKQVESEMAKMANK